MPVTLLLRFLLLATTVPVLRGTQAGREPVTATTTISGTVVDGAGKPLDLVFVLCIPVMKGTFAHAQTDESGAFSISVAKDGMNMVTLEIEDPESVLADASADPKHGMENDTSAFIQGGRTDLRLVLRNPKLATFVVLDDATGQPVERYGLGIASKPNFGTHGSIDMEEIPLRPHARGESVAHADPAKHVVRVQAPGFASMESNVEPDGGAGARQTLRMKRGGSLVGKVSGAGRPLSRASVGVVRGPLGEVYVTAKGRYEPDSWFLADYPRDLGDYVGRPRLVESGEDGSFRVDDLSPGTYDVLVEATGLGPKLSKRVRVDAGGVRDLGVLVLEAPAVLRGKVVVGPGVSPIGLEYSVDGHWHQRRPITEADGSFVIEGLGAGLHQLTLQRSPFRPNDDVREVRLAAGETKEIVFDLSKTAPCEIEVRVTRAGEPVHVAGVLSHLVVQMEAPGRDPWKGEQVGRPRRTEGAERFTCSAPGGHEIYFVALGDVGQILGRSPVETLPSGGRRAIVLAIDPGSLEILLPDSVEVPKHGTLEVTLQRRAEQMQILVAKTEPSPNRSETPVWSSKDWKIGWLEPGEYDVFVRAQQEEVDADGNPDPGRSRSLISGFRTTVTVRPRELAIVAVK